ncbi:universal stress protein [Paenibacillus sp. UNC451MF]|uniref:universal stress protein n=1 Tax=Paenibacillus sp. UNC451MF TaxID=1449063 RepID=UPI00056A2F5B|nr:universal stress protein [Paenibacillus sp. UNC451MF]
MFGKILLAYDGSETAKNALEQAMEMKILLPDSILEIVHVAQLNNIVVGDAFITSSAAVQDELHDAAEAVLDEARQRIAYLGLATTTLLEGGAPAQMILDYAEANLFDLIIVGSRGLGTFKELLLGSVSYEIVQHAQIPVLVVK